MKHSTTRPDVRRDDDGSWHIRAGARVRVNLAADGTLAALPRGSRGSAARRTRAARPIAGHHARDAPIRRLRGRRHRALGLGGPGLSGPLVVVEVGRGSTTRTYVTTGPRRSRRCCGRARTGTTTRPVRRPRAPSPPVRRRPRRCTRPRSVRPRGHRPVGRSLIRNQVAAPSSTVGFERSAGRAERRRGDPVSDAAERGDHPVEGVDSRLERFGRRRQGLHGGLQSTQNLGGFDELFEGGRSSPSVCR